MHSTDIQHPIKVNELESHVPTLIEPEEIRKEAICSSHGIKSPGMHSRSENNLLIAMSSVVVPPL
jgi:hypothetical protein